MPKYRKKKNLTAFLINVEVYYDSKLVGKGYYIYHENGGTGPALIDNDGEPLREGWYQLSEVGEPKLVVWNRTIQ